MKTRVALEVVGTTSAWRLAAGRDRRSSGCLVVTQVELKGDASTGYFLLASPDGFFAADDWFADKAEALFAAEESYGIDAELWRVGAEMAEGELHAGVLASALTEAGLGIRADGGVSFHSRSLRSWLNEGTNDSRLLNALRWAVTPGTDFTWQHVARDIAWPADRGLDALRRLAEERLWGELRADAAAESLRE